MTLEKSLVRRFHLPRVRPGGKAPNRELPPKSGDITCMVMLKLVLVGVADVANFSTGHEQLAVLQIRRGKRDNLGILFHITPLKHMLQAIIRTVSARRF